MSCKPAYFGGYGDCTKLLSKMSGGVIQKKGSTWTDADIITASKWHTVIADDDSSVRNAIPLPIRNFVNNTDEMEILTSPLGHKDKGSDPIPSGILYLKVGKGDYNWMHALDGKEFEFFPFFQGGAFWSTRKADGNLKGYRCKLGTVDGLPPEDRMNSFALHIFFDDPEEFKNTVVISPDNWRFSDLVNYVPVGLNIRVVTAFTAGVVDIYCEKVGSGSPMTGLSDAADWEIMDSNATPTVVVTAVTDSGLGRYLLTIKKDNDGTPANLAATDWIDIQAHDVDATPTYLTYISQVIRIYGA